VEVYVRYLRQKLEAEGEGRLLHTVRGRGYCLGPFCWRVDWRWMPHPSFRCPSSCR
jgi:hypothetical protein